VGCGALQRVDGAGRCSSLPLRPPPPGRRSPDEITLFKSVGAAIEDLAAAILVWRKAGGAEP